eukprot:SAG11_NODE_35267_length_267_cov_0.916667_1_plen_63_part_01
MCTEYCKFSINYHDGTDWNTSKFHSYLQPVDLQQGNMYLGSTRTKFSTCLLERPAVPDLNLAS